MVKHDNAWIAERLAGLPEAAWDDLADALESIEAKHGVSYELSEDERLALAKSGDDLRQGRFASDEEIQALFARHRSG